MQCTKTMYIYVEETWDGKIKFDLAVTDMSEFGWAMVGKTEVTYEVPDNFDFRQVKATAIQKEMNKVRADFQARITELQAQYNECLAIEG